MYVIIREKNILKIACKPEFLFLAKFCTVAITCFGPFWRCFCFPSAISTKFGVVFFFLQMFSHFVEVTKLKEEIPDANNTNKLSKFGMHMEE
jgi:hypothetical protein